MAHHHGVPVTPDIVAVGTKGSPKTSVQIALPHHSSALFSIMPQWKVRDGRGPAFVLWEDAFHDVLAYLRIKRESIYADPPSRPVGSALTAGSYAMWTAATLDFQAQGTVLFDNVIRSLDLDTEYLGQDIRRIQAWKQDGVKDGRSLVH